MASVDWTDEALDSLARHDVWRISQGWVPRPPVFGARHRHFKQEMFRRGGGSLVVNAYLQQVEFRCPELQMACPHCIGATKKQDRYRRSAVAGREVYRIPICHRRPCPAAPGSRALVGEDLQSGQHRARGPSTACHYYS